MKTDVEVCAGMRKYALKSTRYHCEKHDEAKGVDYHAGMRTSHLLLFGVLLAAVSQTQCGRDYGSTGDGNGSTTPQSRQLVLRPAGFVAQQAFPGDDVMLKVVALNSAGAQIQSSADLAPAMNTPITWSFVGTTPQGASVATPTTQTDAQGVAQVSVNVGTTQNLSVQVQATTVGATPVVFTIQIQKDSRRLELVGASPVHIGVGRSAQLRVRLLRPVDGGGTGTPLGGVAVNATLSRNAGDASLDGAVSGLVALTTDMSGNAAVHLHAGSTPNFDFVLQFCNSGCADIAPFQVPVHVTPPGDGVNCTDFTDCNDGAFCDDGLCRDVTTNCDTNRDCQVGYSCNNDTRACEPQAGPTCSKPGDCAAGTTCAQSGHCVPPKGCQSDKDCPQGWTCDLSSGACVPPANTPAVDVRGAWLTTYHFDIHDTLPPFVTQGMGPVVDFLDLVFRNQLHINVPILGPILEAMMGTLIGQYVPPWVGTIIASLADIVHAFDNMRIEGTMNLVQTPTAPVLGTQLLGEEAWTNAHFSIVSLCPGGVGEYNRDPSCADIDLLLNPTLQVGGSVDTATVDVQVNKFYGTVAGEDVVLHGRDARIGLKQVFNVMLNVIANAASHGQYNDFQKFLITVIPCDRLQAEVDASVCEESGGKVCVVPGVKALCEAASAAALKGLHEGLAQIEPTLQLSFEAKARIHGATTVHAATALGSPTPPADVQESNIAGDVDTLPLHTFKHALSQPSWWYAVRVK